tara:strand:+ start:1256 stop:1660 length:405 start_codon:yes stop_codon:yes gene_type:complete
MVQQSSMTDVALYLGLRDWGTIRLEKLIRQIDVGVHDHEKGITQPVQFDIEVLVQSPKGGDSIDNVLDYEYLEQSVNNAISESRAELQETLAGRILDSVMLPEAALAATVSLTKLDVIGFDSQLGCTLVRLPEN